MPYYTEARDKPSEPWNRCWITWRDLRQARAERRNMEGYFKEFRIIHGKRDKTEEVVE